jgi:hypothetical protein
MKAEVPPLYLIAKRMIVYLGIGSVQGEPVLLIDHKIANGAKHSS